MPNLFEKLERAAANLIAQLDNDLQEPIVHAMKGDVFSHGTPNLAPQKRKDSTIAQMISNEGLESKASDLPQAVKRR